MKERTMFQMKDGTRLTFTDGNYSVKNGLMICTINFDVKYHLELNKIDYVITNNNKSWFNNHVKTY